MPKCAAFSDVMGEHAFADQTDYIMAKVITTTIAEGMVGREQEVRGKLARLSRTETASQRHLEAGTSAIGSSCC